MKQGKPRQKKVREQASIKEVVSYIWRASKCVRSRVLTYTLIDLVKVGVSLSFVWVSKLLIDAASDPLQQSPEIWKLAIATIIIMISEVLLAQISRYISNTTSFRLTMQMRHTVYNSVLNNDPYASTRKHSGDIISRVMGDVDTVVGTIIGLVPSACIMLAQLCAACWLLFKMSPMLMLCALLITPICLLISKVFFKRVRKYNDEIRQMSAKTQSNLQEGLQHRVVAQTLECVPEMMSRYDNLMDILYKKKHGRLVLGIYSRTIMRLTFTIGYLIAFIWSVFQLNAGLITFGVMTAFLQLMGRIQGPISGLAGLANSFIATVTAADRLIEVQLSDISTKAKPQPLTGKIGIRFTDVTFRYDDDLPAILSHFSHDFKAGSKVVIMGETGAGKSTMVKLILALLRPESGQIELYSTEQQHTLPVSAQTLCNMVYVPQGNSLLAGTIKENLLLGDTSATEEQMRHVLTLAAADFVYDLPLGLDTPCGELGFRLSEGQCQRIAIARALLRKGNILLLDEFNSSLDMETAAKVRHNIVEEYPDATIIFVSHRSETANDCDEIINL